MRAAHAALFAYPGDKMHRLYHQKIGGVKYETGGNDSGDLPAFDTAAGAVPGGAAGSAGEKRAADGYDHGNGAI